MASRGFFYIDSSNQVSYGGCFSRGDLFSLCINGMAISAVSVLVASLFSLKDFIMLALNSCSVSGIQIVVPTTEMYGQVNRRDHTFAQGA